MVVKEVDITKRTFTFGIKVVKLVNRLPKTPAGYELGRQVVRSGTSIGANVEEAQSAVSKLDFINKLSISLKEARETNYWLRIFLESGLTQEEVPDILKENEQIIKILVTIIKNSKKNIS